MSIQNRHIVTTQSKYIEMLAIKTIKPTNKPQHAKYVTAAISFRNTESTRARAKEIGDKSE
jgi:hypothetical protein